MSNPLTTPARRIVWLATGGTIAGAGDDEGDARRYRAGAFTGDELLRRFAPDLPADLDAAIEIEDVAAIDSKDMSPAVWRALVAAVQRHLRRDEVLGIVISHGTDTLEETAYLLHRLVASAKPVVITGAMRPATAADADGPRNLADALVLAAHPGACGVLVSFAGQVWGGGVARKVHSRALDAFGGGDAPPLASVLGGRVQQLRPWSDAADAWPERWPEKWHETWPETWPVVDIIHSHAGARAATVDALVAAGAQGLVVASTGNGTVHAALQAALQRAQDAGVEVLRASRCAAGGIDELASDAWCPSAGTLTPAQARVELQLRLLAWSVRAP